MRYLLSETTSGPLWPTSRMNMTLVYSCSTVGLLRSKSSITATHWFKSWKSTSRMSSKKRCAMSMTSSLELKVDWMKKQHLSMQSFRCWSISIPWKEQIIKLLKFKITSIWCKSKCSLSTLSKSYTKITPSFWKLEIGHAVSTSGFKSEKISYSTRRKSSFRRWKRRLTKSSKRC